MFNEGVGIFKLEDIEGFATKLPSLNELTLRKMGISANKPQLLDEAATVSLLAIDDCTFRGPRVNCTSITPFLFFGSNGIKLAHHLDLPNVKNLRVDDNSCVESIKPFFPQLDSFGFQKPSPSGHQLVGPRLFFFKKEPKTLALRGFYRCSRFVLETMIPETSQILELAFSLKTLK
jgi:hypothetical protein